MLHNEDDHGKGTCQVNANSTARVKIEAGGEGVVAHVGLHTLGALADRLGLGEALSERIPPAGERFPVHDRGKVLVRAMLMLTGGGEACTDIEHLRAEPALFGSVPSDSTLCRSFLEITPDVLDGLWEAVAEVREQVWRRANVIGGPVVLDIDATLVEIHSENKAGTAPTYKGGFGFGPMLCFADTVGDQRIGESLAALLRPGNAGANKVTDHLTVLDAAIAQLPAGVAAGHRPGDDVDTVQQAVMVRTDSAGCTAGFVAGCRARNVGFAVVARCSGQIHAAISRARADEHRWSPALRQNGEPRDGAQVADLTDLVDLGGWPDGTRLIVCREPLHPGAQQTLFPSESFRYWGHYTDPPGDAVTLDGHMPAHAHIEDHIRRLKDSGLCRFPFRDLDANRACWPPSASRTRWSAGSSASASPPARARPGRAQDAALAVLAHPRPAHPPRPPRHRAHPRGLARRRRAHQRLPAHHGPLPKGPGRLLATSPARPGRPNAAPERPSPARRHAAPRPSPVLTPNRHRHTPETSAQPVQMPTP